MIDQVELSTSNQRLLMDFLDRTPREEYRIGICGEDLKTWIRLEYKDGVYSWEISRLNKYGAVHSYKSRGSGVDRTVIMHVIDQIEGVI